MAKTLRLAQSIGDEDLARWCQLELGGYWSSNPVIDENVIVPEYRAVVGEHYDIYGRKLYLENDLSFVNETRLRSGIDELESLACGRDIVVIHDSDMCELIEQKLKVQVYTFRFSVVHLRGVLASIKLELSNRLMAIQTVSESIVNQNNAEEEEILELKPNIYGIGINLKALWRRMTKGKNRK